MGTQHSPTEAHFINTTISQAMSNAGVAHNSPLKALLARDAEIKMVGSAAWVRVPDEHGQAVSLEDRLAEMKADPRYRHHFPVGPTTVSSTDMRATRERFHEIASGSIRVVS